MRETIARGTANGASGRSRRRAAQVPARQAPSVSATQRSRSPGGVIDTTTVGHNQSADPLLVNPVVGAGPLPHPPAAPWGEAPPTQSAARAERRAAPGGRRRSAPMSTQDRQPRLRNRRPVARGRSARTPRRRKRYHRPTSGKPQANYLPASRQPHRVRGCVDVDHSGSFAAGDDVPGSTSRPWSDDRDHDKCQVPAYHTQDGPNRRACTVARLTAVGMLASTESHLSGRIRGRPRNGGDYRAVFGGGGRHLGSEDPPLPDRTRPRSPKPRTIRRLADQQVGPRAPPLDGT